MFDSRFIRQDRTVFIGKLVMSLIQKRSKKEMEIQWFVEALGGINDALFILMHLHGL